MCILDLSKVLIYKFHSDYIRNKYGSNLSLLFSETDTLMYEIKTEDFYEDFSKYKAMFNFSNYSAKSIYYDNSNKLVVGKMKDETDGVANEEFFGLTQKMHSFLVDNNSEHKKAKGVTKNVAERISHSEYYVLLNQNCLRHSINRTQSKNHGIETYKINNIFFFALVIRYIS